MGLCGWLVQHELAAMEPLLRLGGRSLLDHALDRLAAAGVGEAVVNAHWRGEQVAAAMAARTQPRITVQMEEVLLETGGGVAVPGRVHAQPVACSTCQSRLGSPTTRWHSRPGPHSPCR